MGFGDMWSRHAEDLYDRGAGLLSGREPGSQEKGVRLVRRAALLGCSNAQAMLGWLYCSGSCVPQSYEKATRWCRKAADRGHAGAQYDLATMYEEGKGVPQSYEEALRRYRLAVQWGNGLGEERLRALEERLSEEQGRSGISSDASRVRCGIILRGRGFRRRSVRSLQRLFGLEGRLIRRIFDPRDGTAG